MDVSVRENLEKEVKILEAGVRLRLIFMRGMAVLFILIIESLMYWTNELTGWNAQPVIGRVLLYVVVFTAFYLLTHFAVKHRYTSKIDHLKELVKDLIENE